MLITSLFVLSYFNSRTFVLLLEHKYLKVRNLEIKSKLFYNTFVFFKPFKSLLNLGFNLALKFFIGHYKEIIKRSKKETLKKNSLKPALGKAFRDFVIVCTHIRYDISGHTMYFELIMENENELIFKVQIPKNADGIVRVYPGKKKRYFKGMEWTLIFREMFEILASDKELTLTDIRVLHGLLSHLDYGNVIDITQAQLAEELQIKRPNIATSIKKLIAKKYILILGQRGKQNIYTLNPHLGLRAKETDKPMLDRSWEERTRFD